MPTESCSWIASFAPHASLVVPSSTPVFRYEREARYGTGVVVESFGTVACIGPAPIDADQMQKYEQTERPRESSILSIRRPRRGCAMSEMRLPLVRPHVGVLGATVREYVGASILETRGWEPLVDPVDRSLANVWFWTSRTPAPARVQHVCEEPCALGPGAPPGAYLTHP